MYEYAKNIDESAEPMDVRCSCGMTVGYILEDEKLILCDACYRDAANIERGE